MLAHRRRGWCVAVLVSTRNRAQRLQALRGRIRRIRRLPHVIRVCAILLFLVPPPSIRHETCIFISISRKMLLFKLILVWIARVHKRQLPRHIHPRRTLAKRLLISIEAAQIALFRLFSIEGGVLVVSEGEAGGGYAFTIGLLALRADRSLFRALELYLQSVSEGLFGVKDGGDMAYLPRSTGHAAQSRSADCTRKQLETANSPPRPTPFRRHPPLLCDSSVLPLLVSRCRCRSVPAILWDCLGNACALSEKEAG